MANEYSLSALMEDTNRSSGGGPTAPELPSCLPSLPALPNIGRVKPRAWRYSTLTKKAEPLVQVPGSMQHSSRISPDEHWLAYVSNETGRFEIYVQPLPTTGAKFRITKEGGEHPVWSVDGREIFYDHNGRLYAIPVQTAPSVIGGNPAPLPITGFIQDSGRRQFDLTSDSKQFLMLFPPTQ